ncbi:MAG TPA: DUF402 domain-containing protein [Candidatus Lokiarchaeia archaeon]|nr:DUF402 domain-containing protein [Candidatus Lokiarchaeia archaeon]
MAKACKIRGIYSTALSILFSGTSEYELTFPSQEIMKRLGISPASKPADIKIEDRPDSLGVIVEGKMDDIMTPEFPLNVNDVPGCAVIPLEPNKFAIYKGTVVSRNERYNYVNVLLDDAEGLIGILPGSTLRPGTEVIVQVAEPGSISGKKKPVLSRSITCPGSYVVLIPENKIVFSRNITDPALRSELEEMARQDAAHEKGKFGVIFRSACNDAHMDAIREDLDALAERMADVRAKMRDAPAGFIIDPFGIGQLNVIFSKQSLNYLDDIRQQKVSTIPDHHYWKIVTKRLKETDRLIDFLEYVMVQQPELQAKLVATFVDFAHEQFIFPQVNDMINIVHCKPNGDIHKLRPGKVLDTSISAGRIFSAREHCISLVLKREFTPKTRSGSFYDGFDGIEIEAGDYSICHVKENFPVLVNQYYRADGTLLGHYFNISTPVQLYPGEMQYIDLEVDVVEVPGGERKVIDEEKLDDAVRAGYISEKTRVFAMTLAHDIMDGKINADLACDANYFEKE